MKRRLLVDLDGTVANYDEIAIEVFDGMTSRMAEQVHGKDYVNDRLRSHPSGFFRLLPLMPGAVEMMVAFAPFKPVFLSSCPAGGWAEEQKALWVGEHFPSVPLLTCRGASLKYIYARPGDVLVDDYQKYRSLWINAGGIFIHYQNAEQATKEVLDIFGSEL